MYHHKSSIMKQKLTEKNKKNGLPNVTLIYLYTREN